MGSTSARVVRHRLAIGLFLLRLVVAVGVLSGDSGWNLVDAVLAFLLVCGLWTSTVGAVIACIEVWSIASGSGAWVSGSVAALAVTVALTGPGAWSIDTQLCGWRRIQIPPRERDGDAVSR
jgi:hypothetical protein